MHPKMIENAEGFRAQKKRIRERGGSTVRVFATTADMVRKRAPVEPGSWEMLIAETRARLLDKIADQRAERDFVRLSKELEGCNDVPF